MLDQSVDAASPSLPHPTTKPHASSASWTSSMGAHSTIGKSLLIKGEITGSESVHIEGKVEGSIELPDERVTVGRNGRVSATVHSQ